ncbi:uncharacterized protein PHALS_00366 [Plasmopara halstedii]|uniref:Uncharacterized protein n=1 Tax=Plasmopara halstedii TaxID=4781 RepID=A0A0P1A637_PLAHL|nr:uncharacterized protein PHALS_00366 [Plasmopara halstedii]CEG36045.1 hypothetical protein PHALS_00366 [Plasmopara halstedii]|eukprot:XP_024572414.1 hypothetical protein PHALS_00366 [Plasmopara halstedii]
MKHNKSYRVLNLDNGNVKTSRSVALDERGVSSIYHVKITNKPHEHLYIPIDENMAPCVSQPTQSDDVIIHDELVDNDERMSLAVDTHISTSSIHLASLPQTEITHDSTYSGKDATVFHSLIHCRQPNHSQHQVLRDVPHTQQRLQIESDATPERRIVASEPVGEYRQHDDSDHMDVRPPKRSRINDDDGMVAFMAVVPTSFSDATNEECKNHWEQTIQNEIDLLVRNNTWDIVDFISGM